MPKLPPLSIDRKPKIRYKNAGKLKGKVRRDGTKEPPLRTDAKVARKMKAEAEALAKRMEQRLQSDLEETSKRGRPSSYRPEFAEIAQKAMTLGATRHDLAEILQVSKDLIYRWSLQHEDFARALKTGAALADDRVEASLYRKAVGFEFESEKIFQYEGVVVRAETREVVHPDTTAAIFWLKNRRPDQWRDRQENVNMNVTMEVAFDQFIRELQFSKGQAIDVEATPIEGPKQEAAE